MVSYNKEAVTEVIDSTIVPPSKRKKLSDVTIDGTRKMRKPNYFLKVELLKGFIEVYWCEVDRNNDAFFNHVHKAIETDPQWKAMGFMCSTFRRKSINDGENFLANNKDNYPRKVIVRILDSGETSTTDTRMEHLKRLQRFCMDPANNRFDYEYVIDASSDLTPEEDAYLASADSYIQDFVICNIIKAMYTDADVTWYSNNQDIAREYWCGPEYPTIASEELGYPRPDVNPNMLQSLADSYNAPPAEESTQDDAKVRRSTRKR